MPVVLVPSGGTWVPQYTIPSSNSSIVPVRIPSSTGTVPTASVASTGIPIHISTPTSTPTTSRVPINVQTPAPQPIPAPTPVSAPSPASITLSSDEQTMISLVNQQRAAAGVLPVKVDSRLMSVGRQKAQDMKTYNYFGHISPTYGTPWAQMESVGLTVHWAAENITTQRTVSGAMSNFMNSPAHRANILDSRFTHIGVGITYGTSYGTIYVQEFLQE